MGNWIRPFPSWSGTAPGVSKAKSDQRRPLDGSPSSAAWFTLAATAELDVSSSCTFPVTDTDRLGAPCMQAYANFVTRPTDTGAVRAWRAQSPTCISEPLTSDDAHVPRSPRRISQSARRAPTSFPPVSCRPPQTTGAPVGVGVLGQRDVGTHARREGLQQIGRPGAPPGWGR